jgi:DNA-binding NarL/FixJ family response regulator
MRYNGWARQAEKLSSEAEDAMQRILLVSNRTRSWAELQRLVLQIPGIVGCCEAHAPAGALAQAQTACPSAIICAGRLDGVATLPLLLQLRELCPRAILVIIDIAVDFALIASLRRLRLAGYFIWGDQSMESLFQALTAILSGEVAAGSLSVIERVIAALEGSIPSNPPPPISLTEREEVVLRGLAAGLSYAEIAQQLCAGERTVARCIAHLNEKFGASDRFTLGMRIGQIGIRW